MPTQQPKPSEEEEPKVIKQLVKTPRNLWWLSKKAGIIYIVIAGMLLSFGVGVRTGETTTKTVQGQEQPEKVTADFDLFWDIWERVNSKFVDRPLDQQKLLYGAIKGMISATEDPYSQFLTPEETALFNSEIKGEFEGIGAEIGLREEGLTVVSPLEGSPAEQAGLKAGDQIKEIDGESTQGLTLKVAVGKIRGPKGSIVKLNVLRKGENELKAIEITRNTIEIDSVKLEMVDSIAHIELKSFSQDTVSEMDEIANKILSQNAKGIILDVRNNPGGLLGTSINIASLFLNKEDVVVIEDRGDNNTKKHTAAQNNKLNHLPIIVLMNEGSASASEILAGALRDNKEIKLIGAKTFGKGSVQDYELIPTDDGQASVRITIAKWLTPNGTSIHENGLEPDEAIEEDPETELDEQFEYAKNLLK